MENHNTLETHSQSCRSDPFPAPRQRLAMIGPRNSNNRIVLHRASCPPRRCHLHATGPPICIPSCRPSICFINSLLSQTTEHESSPHTSCPTQTCLALPLIRRCSIKNVPAKCLEMSQTRFLPLCTIRSDHQGLDPICNRTAVLVSPRIMSSPPPQHQSHPKNTVSQLHSLLLFLLPSHLAPTLRQPGCKCQTK